MKLVSGRNMNKLLKVLALAFLGFSFFGCQIGLGEEIDMIPPTLEVLTPERNSSVPQTVTISGTAKDNIGVTDIQITVEKDGAAPHSYRYFENSWHHNVNNNWVEFAEGSVTGNKTDITWEIRIPVSDASTGDSYTITTNVYDQRKNEGKSSKDERKILIDIKEPVVSINKPTVTSNYATAKSDSESYELCNNNYLQKLINQDIEISGYQKEDSQLDYLLVFLDKETTDTLPALGNPITNYLFKKEITGSQLKNWTVTIPQNELADYQTGKHLFRLITESHDKAGNVERKVQGWFTYWNDADAPWVYADFGKTEQEFNALAAANKLAEANIYPGCSLQGQAYDDDGLASVTIKTWKCKNDVWSEYKTVTVDLASENNPKYYAWTTYALAETCQFYVEASCTDINGLTSVSSVRKYMNVSDVTPPKITVTTSTQTSLFGDASGNFTIAGNVIDDDVERIPELVLVWIKNVENQKNYVDTGYNGWKQDISATTGDKRFEITLPPRDVNKPQYYGEFSKPLNIFTDLNIGIGEGKNSLNTQIFALKATDNGGQSTTTFLSFSGDYEKPSLSIEYIKVDDGEAKYFNAARAAGSGTLLLPPFSRDAAGNIASKVQLFGRWSDDSTDKWTDKTKIGKVELEWAGYKNSNNKNTVNITMNADGTWESEKITPPDSSTASITATLKDIGNNIATTNECFNININRPELVRLSANTVNGNYKAGKEIELTMEFNKAVKFVPENTGDKPKLKINLGTAQNPKYAEYVSGNESAKHLFKYTIVAGDNTSDLDVSEISVPSGMKWVDVTDENTLVENIGIPVVEANKLKGNRDIVIDTTLPSLFKFEASSASGYYNLNKQLYFTLTFSEEVSFVDSEYKAVTINNSAVKLLFNNGDESSEVTKTGPKTLLFKYDIDDTNHDIAGLKATAVQFGTGVKVVDNAKNELQTADNKLTVSDNSKTYNIDTKAPAAPVINLLNGVTSSVPVYGSSVQFEITGWETATGTQKKYKVDSGSYNDYTGTVTISTYGSHTVYAYQIDAAGNQGTSTAPTTFFLDNLGNVLTNVNADKPNGTYTVKKVNGDDVGDEIKIQLVFRKPVTIENGKISVNVANSNNSKTSKELTCDDGSTEKATHSFTYTVSAGDSCSALNVIADASGNILSGTVKDADGVTIPATAYTNPTGHTLTDNKDSIKVITNQPTVTSVTLDGTTLKIKYSADIVKGNGKNIVITHGDGYKAPAVLSSDDYKKLLANNSALSTYYELGTNGSDANGVSDLTEKYILKYSYDTTTTAVVNALKTARGNVVSVPVNSSYVSVNKDTLEVLLTDSYALPVKGAAYSVDAVEGLVLDRLSHTSVRDNSKTITAPGVEAPVIRIQKVDETINVSAKKVTQPATAGVKIDCQTPDSTVSWEVKKQTNEIDSYTTTSGAITKKTVGEWDTSDSETYTTNPFNIGSDSDKTSGFIYYIRASAVKGSSTETADEYAYRTVYRLTDATSSKGPTGYTQLWLRGGDWTNGGNSTPGYPISWNTENFDKARAMSKVSNAIWYYITWKINATAYPNPLRGDLPEDAATNGPSAWIWGMQGPVPTGLLNYPLYPGQGLSISASVNYKYGSMSFYTKHAEYRDGTAVVKAYKELEGEPIVVLGDEIIPSGTSYTIPAGWSLVQITNLNSFTFKEGTLITVYSENGKDKEFKFRYGDWNTDGNKDLMPNVKFDSDGYYEFKLSESDGTLKAFTENKLYAYGDGMTITSIKAYNPE